MFIHLHPDGIMKKIWFILMSGLQNWEDDRDILAAMHK